MAENKLSELKKDYEKFKEILRHLSKEQKDAILGFIRKLESEKMEELRKKLQK